MKKVLIAIGVLILMLSGVQAAPSYLKTLSMDSISLKIDTVVTASGWDTTGGFSRVISTVTVITNAWSFAPITFAVKVSASPTTTTGFGNLDTAQVFLQGIVADVLKNLDSFKLVIPCSSYVSWSGVSGRFTDYKLKFILKDSVNSGTRFTAKYPISATVLGVEW